MKAPAVVLLTFAVTLFGCGGGTHSTIQQNVTVPAVNPPQTVVFIGDSLTLDWDFQNYFGTDKYINKAETGDAAWRAEDRFQADV